MCERESESARVSHLISTPRLLGVAFQGSGSRVQGLEMCSGSEAGLYVRLIDFVFHSFLG